MQFLYPQVLLLLILLIVLIFLLSTNKDNMERFFNKNILKKLTVNTKSMAKTTRNIFFFFTLILFVITLARPVMNMKDQTIKQKLIPIVIALDVSKSMMATDIYPSRLTLGKQKLKDIISLAKDATIGIVLFAQNSYIVSPITEDFTSLAYIVDNLDTTLNFANGSNIYAVLEATQQMLQDYKVKNLIILSDGGNDNEYLNELEFAKENDIAIYTVGLATKQGSPIPTKDGYLTDKSGKIVTVSLNESIKNLALNSQGGYIDFSLAKDDIEAIITQIQKQSKKEELTSKKIKTYTELFYYPLALAMFCLLIAFSSLPKRKSNIINISLFMILTLIYPQNTQADIFDFKNLEKARVNYENKKYKDAISNYKSVKTTNESNYNLGNSYYKNGNFKKAIESYDKIVTSDKNLEYKKLHNLGNSYVKEKNLKKAKDFYEKALKLKDDKQTKENLEEVIKALKKKKNKDNKKDDKKENKEEKDKKKNQKDKDKKEQDKKDKKKDKDKKSDKQKDKKENKKSDKKDKKSKDKNDQNKTEQKNIKKQPISDMEEKKWMKSLQDKKTPIMLRKVKTKQDNININQPW